MTGISMIEDSPEILYRNSKYKVSLVDNPLRDLGEFEPPQIYAVENLDTGVVEVREVMLPKAVSYAKSSEEVLKHLIDGIGDLGIISR